MVKYVPRGIESHILALLSYFPAIGLVGARQVGKTTLVKALDPNFVYLDLEDDRERANCSILPVFYGRRFFSFFRSTLVCKCWEACNKIAESVPTR